MEIAKQYNNKLGDLAASKLCKFWILSRVIAFVAGTILMGMLDLWGLMVVIVPMWIFKLIFDMRIASRSSAGKNVNFFKYINRVTIIKIILTVFTAIILINKAGSEPVDPLHEEYNSAEYYLTVLSCLIVAVPVLIYHICMRYTYKRLISKENQIIHQPLPTAYTVVNVLKIAALTMLFSRLVPGLFVDYKLVDMYYVELVAVFVFLVEALLKYALIKMAVSEPAYIDGNR